MKTFIYKLIFPFIFLNLTYFIHSQDYWSKLNGPFGGEVISVQKNSTGDLFALRNEGLYKSGNGAETWSEVPESIANSNLCMDISPSGIVYVGKSSGGIWWTANSGQSWDFNPINVAPHSGSWASVVVAKVGPTGHVYVNSYVSFNGGTTFNRISIGSPEKVPADYAFNGSLVYAATSNGVYYSDNNGSSWTMINGNLPTLNVSSLMFDNNILIASVNGSGVYKTSNNGTTWEPVNNGISDLSISKLYRDDQNNYFASTNNGKLYKSVNSGSSWTEIYTSESGNRISSIISTGSMIYLSTKNYGVLKSVDNGITWSEKNYNLNLPGVSSLAFSYGEEIFAASYNGIQYSFDNGSTWLKRINGLPSPITYSVYLAQDHSLLAGVYHSKIYRSSDFGESWFPSSTGISEDAAIKIIRSSPDGSTYAVSLPGAFVDTMEVYRSIDHGFNWLKVLQPESAGMSQFAIDAEGNLFVAGLNQEFQASLLSSTDNGFSWNENLLGSFFDVQNLTASGKNIYLTFSTHIHYSSDRGVTWNEIPNGSWNTTGFSSISVNGLGYIFAAVGSEVYLTTNTGVSWTLRNSGLTEGDYINKFAFNNAGYIFGITNYNGVFKSAQSTLTHTNNNSGNIPENFSLSQNFPNPFNPSTIIRYQIPSDVKGQTSDVKLIVYNSTGMEIRTLVNEKQGSGIYEVKFDGSGFASGIYFYKIEAGNFSEVKKMILLK
ncbi:MAG: T9SS type A sorting domain-containing protein [Ignavibacteria bacterium]